MKAGWIGQMAGVAIGGPTEFRYQGQTVPADKVPGWKPEMINQFDQDDLYVEMTFLRTLEQHGLGASARQAGIDFANSRYPALARQQGRPRAAPQGDRPARLGPPRAQRPRRRHRLPDRGRLLRPDRAGAAEHGHRAWARPSAG